MSNLFFRPPQTPFIIKKECIIFTSSMVSRTLILAMAKKSSLTNLDVYERYVNVDVDAARYFVAEETLEAMTDAKVYVHQRILKIYHY